MKETNSPSTTNHSKDIAHAVGQFIEYWGFKSIQGRVWSLIYLSKEPISTPQIVSRLEVSKGSVSIAVNDLLSFELIVASDKTTFGAQTYVAALEPAQVVRTVLKSRELEILTEAERTLEKLSSFSEEQLAEENLCKHKINQLNELNSASKTILQSMIKKKINTMEEWTDFLKLGSKFLKF